MALMDKGKASEYGILVDYEWCTGCHACEMACQMDKGLPIGQTGVKVFQMGPWKIGDDRWQYDYSVIFGDLCDLCAERVAGGRAPTCVKHCEAQCMTFGPIGELHERLASHPKQALFAL